MDTEQRIQAKTDTIKSIKQKAKRMIWVTFQRTGIHHYPAAGTDPALADVHYLSYDHRHVFHFKIAIEVFHNDREIEFILFKEWVEELYDAQVLQLDSKSCEMISDEIYDKIALKYPDREVIISVSEDNENGSTIQYTI